MEPPIQNLELRRFENSHRMTVKAAWEKSAAATPHDNKVVTTPHLPLNYKEMDDDIPDKMVTDLKDNYHIHKII